MKFGDFEWTWVEREGERENQQMESKNFIRLFVDFSILKALSVFVIVRYIMPCLQTFNSKHFLFKYFLLQTAIVNSYRFRVISFLRLWSNFLLLLGIIVVYQLNTRSAVQLVPFVIDCDFAVIILILIQYILMKFSIERLLCWR